MSELPLSIGTMHFTGIGGIGMSGIAEILFELGYKIQGSDASDNANVRRLRDKGMNPVTREQGQQASEAIGALAFYEISCEEEGDPLDKVFREVLELVFGTPKPKPNGRRGRSGKNENCIIS